MTIQFIEVTTISGGRIFFNIETISHVREYGFNKIEVCLNNGVNLMVNENYTDFINRIKQ